MRESSLYGIIESFMRQKGYTVLREFPVGKWFPKRVDLVGVKFRFNQLVCVEVKLRNFRRILEQAYYRLLFSDYVYVAFPHPYARYVARVYKGILKRYGLGLMVVDGNVEVPITPQQSEILDENYKGYVINLIKEKFREGVK